MTGGDVEIIKRSSTLYLLKLKEHYRIPQVALDYVVEGTKGLLSQTIQHVEAAVSSKLSESEMVLNGLGDVFQNVINPFEGIDTEFLQEKYYREQLGLIVSYVRIFMVSKYVLH